MQTAAGGPLTVELVEYEAGRGNVLITYPGKTDRCVSFVGSHMDVVPADPALWERNPFKLIVEGDKLYGRGTTDCLGHVAMITCLFVKLAQLKPDLDISVHAVFIASEEAEAKVRRVRVCVLVLARATECGLPLDSLALAWMV